MTWQVAAQSGQYIKYQCKKGQCGTCEVRVDGKWIRTCVSQARRRACHRAPYRAHVMPCIMPCITCTKCASLARHCRTAPSRGGQVPYVDPGQTYKVQVKSSMKVAKTSSRFYSFRCDCAAVNPPRAQGTPPALAPGANPNACAGAGPSSPGCRTTSGAWWASCARGGSRRTGADDVFERGHHTRLPGAEMPCQGPAPRPLARRPRRAAWHRGRLCIQVRGADWRRGGADEAGR